MRDFLMAGLVSATLGTLLAPLLLRIAVDLGFVDRPDSNHKRHREPVPLGGGLLIFVSTAAGLAFVALISSVARTLLHQDRRLALGFVVATLVLLAIGILDDYRGMRGRHKLLGQILAALLLTACGLEIRQVQLLGWTIELGVVAVPFTVFWLLGSINALNLLDGLDGLAGTIGLITALMVACVSIFSGQAFAAMLAIALAGGCLAFVHVNLPPAKMFLGDTGSMLIGLMLGGLSAVACSNGPGMFSLAPAAALMALPIFDSTFALLRRRLTGRSIYMADRGHLHHCVMQALGNHHATLVVIALASQASSLSAAMSVYVGNDGIAIIGLLLTFAVLVGLRLFGHVECQLTLRKIAARCVQLLRRAGIISGRTPAQIVSVQLQGERPWNLLWESLIESAEKLQLLCVDLDVNLPAVKESFHANWCFPTSRERHECWRLELPLFVEGRAVGRLLVTGERRTEQDSFAICIDQLAELLEPFEVAFASLAIAPPPVGPSRATGPAESSTRRVRTMTPNDSELESRIARPDIRPVSVGT